MVTQAQARICGDFMRSLEFDGEDFAAPLDVLDRASEYAEYAGYRSSDPSFEGLLNDAAIRLANAIERWMRTDRVACVGLLGPGLGIDQ